MKIYRGLNELPQALSASVVTLGNFDGLHLGHQALVAGLVNNAKQHKLPSVVVTFDPHPVQVLRPWIGLQRLFDLQDLQEQLAKRSVDHLVIEPFTPQLAEVSAESFLKDWICAQLAPKKLIVGYDFHFGSGRKGGIEFLREVAPQMGFELEVMEPVATETGLVISSSEIRKALALGQVDKARHLLGRPFYLRGRVERGAGRGRQLGFPTANLAVTSETLPLKGVYICRTTWRDKVFPGLVNVGSNPTFTQGEKGAHLKVEVHLWEQKLDLYDQELRIEFLHFLRPERPFQGAEALVEQIHQDIQEAQRWWGEA